MAAIIKKVTWAIYTAPPETIFVLWTALVIMTTSVIITTCMFLAQEVTFKRLAETWATDELKAVKARNTALVALVEELERDNETHSNVWTALMATLSRTKGRKRTIFSLNTRQNETEDVI